MNDYQAASLHIAELTAWASITSAATGVLVVILMAVGIWRMVKANKGRAEDAAEDRKTAQDQIAQHAKEAAEDRKLAQERAAEDRNLVREQIAQQAKDAAEDRKLAQKQEKKTAADAAAAAVAHVTTPNREEVTGLLEALRNQGAALERQGKALEEIIRHTKDPDGDQSNVTKIPKRGGPPRPGPAE